MKAQIYNLQGEKKKEVELPKLFSSKIREDIVAKCYEAEKFSFMQPYAPYKEAGKRHSASGTISHRRHEWKGYYGKGMSRIPRKTMSRRGTQFFWVGAEISSARGGRRAHPPTIYRNERKINKKEKLIAMHSAFAATANEFYTKQRYQTLNPKIKLPLILESPVNMKAKDLIKFLKILFNENFSMAIKSKKIRAGKGKLRGRKYKSNAGILLIKSKAENIKMKGIDIKSLNEIRISDLYPLGRLSIFTEKSLEELGGMK